MANKFNLGGNVLLRVELEEILSLKLTSLLAKFFNTGACPHTYLGKFTWLCIFSKAKPTSSLKSGITTFLGKIGVGA